MFSHTLLQHTHKQAALVSLIRAFRVDDAEVRRVGLALYRETAEGYFAGKQSFTEEELKTLEQLQVCINYMYINLIFFFF